MNKSKSLMYQVGIKLRNFVKNPRYPLNIIKNRKKKRSRINKIATGSQ